MAFIEHTWEFAVDPESGMSVTVVPCGDQFHVWYDIPKPQPGAQLQRSRSFVPDEILPMTPNNLRELACELLFQRLHNRANNGHKHPLDPSFDPHAQHAN